MKLQKEKALPIRQDFSFCLLLVECFAVAAENVYEFVFDAFLNERSCGSKILSGIEMRRILDEMLSDSGSKGETQVGVDVDFANSHGCGFSQHIFRNAFCSGHRSAVLIDDVDVFGDNGGSAV